jgi:hypothetical protein
MKRILSYSEIAAIVLLALVPIFASFPYRINIFLSWEGAYRISQGQVPFRDFGMPVGYMYWAIPAAFFKIFGAKFITLIKAQAFINIIGGLAFRSILKSAGVDQPIRIAAVLTFCLSYSFPNFWPWYNHTVIIYQLIGLAFLMHAISLTHIRGRYLCVALSAIFIFLSFFTKQDAGGLGLLISIALLTYHGISAKEWKTLLFFSAVFALTALAIFLPLPSTAWTYWFNHGQAPHSSRISIRDIIGQFLGSSQWIKFYLFLIVVLIFSFYRKHNDIFTSRKFMIFTLLTLGILAEAAIFQVTSYVPEDNNIFFHSFAIAYILWLTRELMPSGFQSWTAAFIMTAGVLLWWSPVFWKYIERFALAGPDEEITYMEHQGYRYANKVNRNTFMIELDTTDIPMDQWRTPALASFEKIQMPSKTADLAEKLVKEYKGKSDLKVLNMSELTPLAAEIPFKLETGAGYPLWFHKGVGMFDKETKMFVDRIRNNYYDLVLYEYIPYLNNFYPYEVREALMQHYQRTDVVPAPRKPAAHAWLEVYKKKQS